MCQLGLQAACGGHAQLCERGRLLLGQNEINCPCLLKRGIGLTDFGCRPAGVSHTCSYAELSGSKFIKGRTSHCTLDAGLDLVLRGHLQTTRCSHRLCSFEALITDCVHTHLFCVKFLEHGAAPHLTIADGLQLAGHDLAVTQVIWCFRDLVGSLCLQQAMVSTQAEALCTENCQLAAQHAWPLHHTVI